MAVESLSLSRLKNVLGYWDARLRLQQSLIWLPRGLGAGLLIGLLLAGAARLWPILPTPHLAVLSGILALIGGVTAIVLVWLWPRSPIELARRFDRLFRLKERMSTAVELSSGVLPIESQYLAIRQYQDALRTAEQIDPAGFLPLRLDGRGWLAALIILALLAMALFLPNPQDIVLAQQAEVEQAIAEQIMELEAIRRQVTEDATLTAEERAAIVELLDEAIKTLEQSDVSQAEALAALQALERDLRDLSERFAEQRQEALQQASGLLDGTAAQEVAEALAQGDVQAAAEALAAIDPANLSAEEQQALAEALEQAAAGLSESNPELAESLERAAGALRSGDAGTAAEALGQAAGQMARSGEQSTQQVDEYADRVQKGQQGLAGAGKGEGRVEQPGQGGMGQAGQAQAGTGQGQGQGQGPHGAGRGEGQGAEQGGVIGENFQMETDNNPGDGGERPFDDIYAPQRIGGEGGEQVDIPGDPGAGLPTGAEGDFAENPAGTSGVPYDQVYADYADAVNKALDSGYVPLGLRDLIRNYFSSLDPSK